MVKNCLNKILLLLTNEVLNIENVVVRKSFRMNRDAYKKQFKVRYYREHFKEDWKAYGANGYLFGYENYLLRSRYLEEKLPPSVCFTDSYFGNRSFYESMVCPMDLNSDEESECCGSKAYNEQFCCTSEAAFSDEVITISIAGLVLLFVLISVIISCYRKLQNDPMFMEWWLMIRGRQQAPTNSQELWKLNSRPESSLQYPHQPLHVMTGITANGLEMQSTNNKLYSPSAKEEERLNFGENSYSDLQAGSFTNKHPTYPGQSGLTLNNHLAGVVNIDDLVSSVRNW